MIVLELVRLDYVVGHGEEQEEEEGKV